jgi:hypothetical protein
MQEVGGSFVEASLSWVSIPACHIGYSTKLNRLAKADKVRLKQLYKGSWSAVVLPRGPASLDVPSRFTAL